MDFRDIDAFSERLAYVMSIGPGELSRIYKTTDGGEHWDLQFANLDAKVFLDSMAFWDAERGMAFSDSVDEERRRMEEMTRSSRPIRRFMSGNR